MTLREQIIRLIDEDMQKAEDDGRLEFAAQLMIVWEAMTNAKTPADMAEHAMQIAVRMVSVNGIRPGLISWEMEFVNWTR